MIVGSVLSGRFMRSYQTLHSSTQLVLAPLCVSVGVGSSVGVKTHRWYMKKPIRQTEPTKHPIRQMLLSSIFITYIYILHIGIYTNRPTDIDTHTGQCRRKRWRYD